MIDFLLQNVGIILNLTGSIFIAISFGPYPTRDTAYTTDDKGRKKFIAYLNYPWLFNAGLILLILGFLFQIEL